jgi:hypothetical protein
MLQHIYPIKPKNPINQIHVEALVNTNGITRNL